MDRNAAPVSKSVALVAASLLLLVLLACRTPEDRAGPEHVGGSTTPPPAETEARGSGVATGPAADETKDEAKEGDATGGGKTTVTPLDPGSGGLPPKGMPPRNQILFEPPAPGAGQPIHVKAGPITFRNGCEGIAQVDVTVEESRVVVHWTPKSVPPDAMCTMALHDDWIEADIAGLAPGSYQVVVREVGEATLVVASEAPAAE